MRRTRVATVTGFLSLVLAVGAPGQICPTCVPLTDLGPGLYQGTYEGGLYAGGSNTPPAGHLAAALGEAGRVLPRDAGGAVDWATGLIGFISLGMSNTTQEFAVFERGEDALGDRNGRVVIVNTAQGGVGADAMADPSHPFWTNALARVASAGLSPGQVQVAWLKQAQGSPPTTLFPQHALNLKANLAAIVQRARALFPNLRLCYVSSRIYGGYSTSPGRWEPLSYETGFAFKWLIEDQVAGDPALNYGHVPGPVNAPLLLWGPYLWANGSTPRSDGLTWDPSDYAPDFIHPELPGEQKVATLLHDFLAADPTAAVWYGPQVGRTVLALRPTDDAWVRSDQPASNFGADADLHLGDSAGVQRRTLLKFDLGTLGPRVRHAKLSLRNLGGGMFILARAGEAWTEAGVTWSSAPPSEGTIQTVAGFSGGGSTSAALTAEAAGDPNGILSLGLTAPSTPRQHPSDESVEPPQLVLLLAPPTCPGDADFDADVDFADVTAVLAAFGRTYAPGQEGPGDADRDAAVTFADITAVLAGWGASCG